MATLEGEALTESYRQDQLLLRAATLQDLLALWPIWEYGDPASYSLLVETTVLLVRVRGEQAAAMAAQFYEQFRAVEGIEGAVAVDLAMPAVYDQIAASIDATGRAGVQRALSVGMDVPTAMDNGFVRVSGSVGRHVLNQGRDTILGAAQKDKQVVAWSRVTGAHPCAFCAMLASRGPVYKSAQSAVSGKKFSTLFMDFRAHDHCICVARPAYTKDDWAPHAKDYRKLWNESVGTKSGKDALNAFRSAIAVL